MQRDGEALLLDDQAAVAGGERAQVARPRGQRRVRRRLVSLRRRGSRMTRPCTAATGTTQPSRMRSISASVRPLTTARRPSSRMDQPLKQAGAARVGADVLRARGDGRQGAVEVEEQRRLRRA